MRLAPTHALVVAFLSLWLTASAWAGWDEVVDAFNRGDFATAIEEWQPLANAGDADAQSKELDQAYRQGQDLFAAGEYEQAVPYYLETLELGEQIFGHDHVTTAIFINNLAVLYEELGDYEAAEPLYRRALEINEEALGLEHQGVAVSLNNLAVLYDNQGRYEAAWTCPALVERQSLCYSNPGFECDRRYVAECGMSSAGIVEAIDILANGYFGLPPRLVTGAPDQL